MKGRVYFILGLLLVATMLIMPSVACGKPTATIVETDANGNVTREALVAGQFLNPDIPRISVQKSYELWDSNNLPAFVDVRPKDLYDTEHVPGARNIINEPEVGDAPAIGNTNKAAYKALPKDKLIILYCD
jgi:hypothetical protein